MIDLQERVFNAIKKAPPPKGKNLTDTNAAIHDTAWMVRRGVAAWVREQADALLPEDFTPEMQAVVAKYLRTMADEIGGIVEPIPGDKSSLRFDKCAVCFALPGAPCWEDGQRVAPHEDRPTRVIPWMRPRPPSKPKEDASVGWWKSP